MKPILLYDTTLRDGTQGENISFTADEKLKIAHRLDDMGIHYIEGGWPGSNATDKQFFELARKSKFKNARKLLLDQPASQAFTLMMIRICRPL